MKAIFLLLAITALPLNALAFENCNYPLYQSLERTIVEDPHVMLSSGRRAYFPAPSEEGALNRLATHICQICRWGSASVSAQTSPSPFDNYVVQMNENLQIVDITAVPAGTIVINRLHCHQ